MPNIKSNITRTLNGEAIINEGNKESSREQVVLVANTTTGYPPNCMLAKFTSGADSGKWGRFNPAAADGSQIARGYLYESRPKSTGTQRATALVRDCELNGKKLDWNGATAPQITTAIASLMSIDTTNAYGNVRVRY